MSVMLIGVLVYAVVVVDVVARLFGITLKTKLMISSVVVTIVCFSGQVGGQSLAVRERFVTGFRKASKGKLSARDSANSALNDGVPFGRLRLTSFAMSPSSVCINEALGRDDLHALFRVGIVSVAHKRGHLSVPRKRRRLCPCSGIAIMNASQRLRDFQASVRRGGMREGKGKASSRSRVRVKRFPIRKNSPLVKGAVQRTSVSSDVVVKVREDAIGVVGPSPSAVFGRGSAM